MIPPYLDLVARIHQELSDLERVVARAERGIESKVSAMQFSEMHFSDEASRKLGQMKGH
ncbi:MAG: hypothetical protein KJ063_14260 [Anaerolineae bacterium]|nr:hypothetical protein [Anaerolineae bacterium]